MCIKDTGILFLPSNKCKEWLSVLVHSQHAFPLHSQKHTHYAHTNSHTHTLHNTAKKPKIMLIKWAEIPEVISFPPSFPHPLPTLHTYYHPLYLSFSLSSSPIMWKYKNEHRQSFLLTTLPCNHLHRHTMSYIIRPQDLLHCPRFWALEGGQIFYTFVFSSSSSIRHYFLLSCPSFWTIEWAQIFA